MQCFIFNSDEAVLNKMFLPIMLNKLYLQLNSIKMAVSMVRKKINNRFIIQRHFIQLQLCKVIPEILESFQLNVHY